jgi:peptide/nickel transport system ATP-binding protein
VSLLEVRDLHTEIRARYRVVHAVDGITFDVEEGETVGLVGESGSGKSMVANSIMRLLPPGGAVTEGQILLAGTDLLALDEATVRGWRGNRVGLIFQDPMSGLNPTMTIGRQVAEPLIFHKGFSRKAALGRARELLDMVSVPRASERLDDYPHQLSGGLRQRVVIAMALACSPRLLIADEPTTALDVTIQAQILALLDDLKAQLNMALLLITHDLGVVAERANRVAVVYAGRVVETAPTGELFARIRHPYTHALFASIPRLDKERARRLYSIPGAPPDLSAALSGCRFAPRCSRAQPGCHGSAPSLRDDGSHHAVACFFPLASEPLASRQGLPTTPSTPAPTPGRAGQISSSPGPGGSEGPAPGVETGKTDAPLEPAGAAPLLELRGLSKVFTSTSGTLVRVKAGLVHALTDVSLSVAKGETLGLVGESGCGKTTLGRIASTLETPSAGQVFFDAKEISTLRERELRKIRRHVQLVFQDPFSSLDPRMKVGAIIREPLVWQREGDKAAQHRRVLELLDQVGLPRKSVDRYPHEFSGGQRQRVALARALALYPRLVIADEPVSALDVSIRSQVLNLMKDLQSEYELTYVVISHDLSVVRYIADRVAVMYLGRVLEVGSGDEIYGRPAHPYTEALLASIPQPNPAQLDQRRPAPVRGELPSARNPPSGCPFRLRCPKAQEICAEKVPPLESLGGTHAVACHFPLVKSGTASTTTQVAANA